MYSIFVAFTDARRAAHIYLTENANLLSGTNKNDLLTVASLYKNMFDIFQGIMSDHTFGEKITVESVETRNNISGKLRRCKELEFQVQEIVKKILDNWEA